MWKKIKDYCFIFGLSMLGDDRIAAMKTAGTRWKRAKVDTEYVAELQERDVKYRERVHETLSEKQKSYSAFALNKKAFKIVGS